MEAIADMNGVSRPSLLNVPPGASACVRSGFYEGLEVPIDRDWVVIGRGRNADVVLAEPTLSRAHAAIGFDEEGFFVQDLGSTNGTQVNGAKCKRHLLKSGDEVQIGKLVIAVTLPA
ncbi:MAG: FHA domain-containing protein [Proteobacteria bacterium]|nr:FHA domain-containing protein [Pseudomonadota bacterium]